LFFLLVTIFVFIAFIYVILELIKLQKLAINCFVELLRDFFFLLSYPIVLLK
ncbi:MAG: hypothetical protein ACI9DJ_002635, partial [Algoriphagus sp.]